MKKSMKDIFRFFEGWAISIAAFAPELSES
jgi:hypothetical protein